MTARVISSSLNRQVDAGTIDGGHRKNRYFYRLLRIASGSTFSIKSNVIGSEKRPRTLKGERIITVETIELKRFTGQHPVVRVAHRRRFHCAVWHERSLPCQIFMSKP